MLFRRQQQEAEATTAAAAAALAAAPAPPAVVADENDAPAVRKIKLAVQKYRTDIYRIALRMRVRHLGMPGAAFFLPAGKRPQATAFPAAPSHTPQTCC